MYDDEHTQGDGRKTKWKMEMEMWARRRRKETENKNGVIAPERPEGLPFGRMDKRVDGWACSQCLGCGYY
jgi:hypothetical protein